MNSGTYFAVKHYCTIQTSFIVYFHFLIENHSSAKTTVFRNYILEHRICGKL